MTFSAVPLARDGAVLLDVEIGALRLARDDCAVHLSLVEVKVEAVSVHEVPVVGQVGLVEESLRVQVHVQALDLVVLEFAEERVAECFRHVARRVSLRVFFRYAVRVPYHER